ncbi:hypothetical protein [Desulfitibacter alkalitolerans]|uniref:hypothetical protein n=1 Tax=Desulfitibacter alkalitolerans TaxID=264641 RepID=UPI000488F735|nr:hypothetical protein [Desulfitibacter alkalitolerans]
MNKDIDDKIRDEFKGYDESIIVPDIEQAWVDFEKNLPVKVNKSQRKRIPRFFLVAAVILLIIVSTSILSNNQAIANLWCRLSN